MHTSPRPVRWPLLVLLAGALLVGGYVWFAHAFDGLSGAVLVVEKAPEGEGGVLLDPARTQRDGPLLARLLDRATSEGLAESANEPEARAARAYVDRIEREQDPSLREPAVLWRGERFLVYLQVS